jgi:hypothetical protein
VRVRKSMKQCRDVTNPEPPEDTECDDFKSKNYGCQQKHNWKIDAARLDALKRWDAIFAQAGEPGCFGFEGTKADLAPLFIETDPSWSVPYGIGTYTGIDKIIEYVGIFWRTLNNDMWVNYANVGIGSQMSPDGNTFTSITLMIGAFADQALQFGPGPFPPGTVHIGEAPTLFQNIKFDDCHDIITSVDVLPTPGMAWLAQQFGILTCNFDRWGAAAICTICKYHTESCEGTPQEECDDETACLVFIRALPTYSDACGMGGPLGGNSFTCELKHHFMAPLVPENHCTHIGPEYFEDSKGEFKCVNDIECPPADYRADYRADYLDAVAGALGFRIGSNYIKDYDVNPAVAAVAAFSN